MLNRYFLTGAQMQPPAPVTLRRAQVVLIGYDPRNTLNEILRLNTAAADQVLAPFDPENGVEPGVDITAWSPDGNGGGGSSVNVKAPPLRMGQRDDGVGTFGGHARVQGASRPSASGLASCRAGDRNVYEPGPGKQGGILL